MIKILKKIATFALGCLLVTGCYSEGDYRQLNKIKEIKNVEVQGTISISKETSQSGDNPVILNGDISSELTTKINNFKGDLPDYLTKEIVSDVYSLVSVDIMALGYDVISAYKKGGEYGLAYTDYTDAYAIEKENNENNIDYVGCGFISFDNIGDENKIHVDPTYDTVRPEEMTYSEYSSFGLFRLLDTKRIEGIKGQYVKNNRYIKYELVGDGIVISNLEKGNYDPQFGEIYDYDNNDYIFIPLSQIPDEITTIQMLVNPHPNATELGAAFDQMIAAQDKFAYSESVTSTLFLSVEMFEMLNGTLNQQPTLNGILIDTINNIKYDPTKQYLTVREDGTIGAVDIPPKLIHGKTLKEWIIDSLIVAGGTLIAVCIAVATGGAGTIISGAIMGAVGNFATQAFVYKKSLSEINIGRVLVAGVVGALTAGIPAASTAGEFFINALGSGIINGGADIITSLLDGETNPEKIAKSAIIQAAVGIGFYSIKCLISGASTTEPAQVQEATVTKINATTYQNLGGKISTSGNQRVLEMTRPLGSSQSLQNVVSGRFYESYVNGGKEMALDLIGNSTKRVFADSITSNMNVMVFGM